MKAKRKIITVDDEQEFKRFKIHCDKAGVKMGYASGVALQEYREKREGETNGTAKESGGGG